MSIEESLGEHSSSTRIKSQQTDQKKYSGPADSETIPFVHMKDRLLQLAMFCAMGVAFSIVKIALSPPEQRAEVEPMLQRYRSKHRANYKKTI